jgi:hypothetical protein
MNMDKKRWEEREQEETRLPHTIVLSDRVTIPYFRLREVASAMPSPENAGQPKEEENFPETSSRRADPIMEDFIQSMSP